MASEQSILALAAAISKYESVDRKQLLRNNLGDESMEKDLRPILESLNEKAKFVEEFASDVGDTSVNSVTNIFTAIATILETQASRINTDYIGNKTSVLSQLASHVDGLLNHFPPFVTSAILKRRFLDDGGIRKEYEQAVEEMKQAASKSVEQLKSESQAALDEARKLANDIESRARRTATKISVQDVQDQFSKAQTAYFWQIVIWSLLLLSSLGVFIGLLWTFLNKEMPETWTWQFGYLSALHVTALGAAGAFASFCMRIFRSQLHMYQLNQHRQRVANSIESFVESAVTPEQRDFILARLVDAVVSFGNSGLLNSDSSDAMGPKFTIDNISRSLTGAMKSKSE